MGREDLRGIWRRAYVDLHVAYLAVLQIRHARRKDTPEAAAKDMAIEDPFELGDPSGADAVQKWKTIWESHSAGPEATAVLAAATEAIRNHWDSWADLLKAFPDRFESLAPVVQSDEHMTSTAASRETFLERGRVLKAAWEAYAAG